jgi:hypothetical protein
MDTQISNQKLNMLRNMKSTCQVCGAVFRGVPLSTFKDGGQVEACPTCYQALEEEYKTNSCQACVFFNVGSCELFDTELEEPYVQNVNCGYFTTDADPKNVAKTRIKKFEMTNRYEDAAKEYEKLGMPDKAEQTRKKAKDKSIQSLNVKELIEQLAQRGQILTYFCCHCGTPLKIGAKNEIQKTCAKCHYDLTIIDIAKLIHQHL